MTGRFTFYFKCCLSERATAILLTCHLCFGTYRTIIHKGEGVYFNKFSGETRGIVLEHPERDWHKIPYEPFHSGRRSLQNPEK